MEIIHKKMNFDSKPRITIIVLSMILLSMTGLSIAELSQITILTPFYLFSPVPLVVWVFRGGKINRLQMFLFGWGGIGCVISIIEIDNAKWLSILHFAFYFIVAIGLIGLLNDNSLELELVCKSVIILNFIIVCISNLLMLFGANVSSLPPVFRPLFYRGSIRYNGFMSEPSYLAMLLTVCMLALIKIVPKSNFRKMYLMAILYTCTTLLANTSLGILSLFFVLIAWFREYVVLTKTTILFGISICGAATIVLCFIVSRGGNIQGMNHYVSRLVNVLGLVKKSTSISEFLYQLNLIDSSAWQRIGPLFLLFEEKGLLSLGMWLGHGIGSSPAFFLPILGYECRDGFLEASIYDQGILQTFIFVGIILKNVWKDGALCIIYMMICWMNCSVSTQAFWFIVIILIWLAKILQNIENYGRKA